MSSSEREVVAPSERRWREEARVVAIYLGSCLLAGLMGGLLIGGVGSRMAMLILRSTSGPRVIGVISDDGFEIGRISTDTLFLFLIGAALGAAVGILYLLTRSWIPPRLRVSAFGLLGATVGGSSILHEQGIDFNVLEPLWLAIAMFIALPTLGGAAIALLAERLLDSRRTGDRTWPVLVLPLLGLIVLGPVGVAVVVAIPLGMLLNRAIPLVQLWTSAGIAWLGRAALTVWGSAASVALYNDLSDILNGYGG